MRIDAKSLRHFSVVVVLLVASVPASLSAGTTPSPESVAFIEWATETAIPFERWTMNEALASHFDTALDNKRIIFLGEPGHFFQEKYDAQLMLIEDLARRGYTHLFIEGLGAAGAAILDQYIATGVGMDGEVDESERAARYRARVLASDIQPNASVFAQRHRAGLNRFYRNLRALNTRLPHELHVYPLDIDMSPGGCALAIADLLQDHADDEAIAALIQQCDRLVEDEPMPTWIARLETVRSEVERDSAMLRATLGDETTDRLVQHIDCLLESLVFHQTRLDDGFMDRALIRREPAMFRQVHAALRRLPDDARVIMMGHCNHLSRHGSETMRARQPSLGEMICEAYPDEVYSIWMLHDHGTLLNPTADPPLEELASDPERVESLLVQAGDNFLLPLHTDHPAEQYLATDRRISYFSWFETTTLTRQTDALLFFNQITAPDLPDE